MSLEHHLDQLISREQEPVTIDETLRRGVEIILPDRSSLQSEMEQRKVRLYLGIDATSPNLHIGHTVPLRKLRQFQDLGHEVIFLFGGFTSLIGDPSDKSATRQRLTPEQVEYNMATYVDQAARILDFSPNSPNPIKIMNNAEWLSKLTLAEVIDIQANFTVQQMLERNMFQERVQAGKPIWLQEFSYPWMQGWDAVAMNVDIEVGGKDQLFNMLVGQTLVRRYKDHEKWVIGTKLIEDPSGKKMGKTEGNIVNILDWPEVKYEGVMAWPDTAIGVGFELITSVPMEAVYQIQEEVLPQTLEGTSGIHPMELKEALAFRMVLELDGEDAAVYAREEFDRVKRQRLLPRRIQEINVHADSSFLQILVDSNLAPNETEAQRLIASGAIYIDGKKETKNRNWGKSDGTIQIGTKTIRNVRRIVLQV